MYLLWLVIWLIFKDIRVWIFCVVKVINEIVFNVRVFIFKFFMDIMILDN